MIFLKQNTVKTFKFFFKLLMLTLIFTAVSYAKTQDANAPRLGDDSNILTIVPSSAAPITVTSSGTTNVSYTVTLASTVTQGVTNIGIDPGFNMPSTLVTASLASDTCSGAALAASASCAFTVALQGVSGQTGLTTLMPRVSGDSGMFYSIPTDSNRVAVTVSNSAPATLTSITVTPSSPTISISGTQQFTAIGHYSDSSTLDITSSVTWSSSSTGVATIAASGGLATGVSAGTTNITASLSGVTSSSDVLTVAAATLVSITITPASPTANIPGTQNITPTQLTATGTYSDSTTVDITNSVNWTSSNTSYGTVTNAGQVTGVSLPAGSTSTSVTITATDPTTHVAGTTTVTVQLVVGSFYNQGYVYCLGTGSGNCAFLPSSNCPSGSACVGEVIAKTDNVSSGTGQQWYNGSYTMTGATDLNNGKTNTNIIVTSQGSGTYAANTCKTYNSGDGNNTWYLPAKNELSVIYTGLTTLNTAGATLNTNGSASPTFSVYWSSTEDNINFAWAQAFSDGFQFVSAKVGTAGVRCVRAF